jgi:hypothetical protein
MLGKKRVSDNVLVLAAAPGSSCKIASHKGVLQGYKNEQLYRLKLTVFFSLFSVSFCLTDKQQVLCECPPGEPINDHSSRISSRNGNSSAISAHHNSYHIQTASFNIGQDESCCASTICPGTVLFDMPCAQ